MMQFVDAAPIAGTRRTADGYLVAEVRTARTGIQDYAGWEVGKPEKAIVKVYRPADQVFSKDSMGSYAHKPVTNDHPDEAVSAANWRDLAVGSIGDEIARDGDFVRIPLVVMDAAAIKLVEDGKRELSAGYTCDLAFESGMTPDGQAYDAIQKDIRINHVAIVKHGRAGSKARIGDAATSWGIAPVTNDQTAKEKIMNLKTVTVDGIPVEVTDQGATVIATLQQRLSDATAKMSTADAAHVAAMASKDTELAKKDAEIDGLKAKVLSDADLDKRVQDRAELVAVAATIAKDVKTAGLSDAAIRKAVVVAKLGDAVIAGKTDAYIDARFDVLADEAKASTSDPVRAALLNRDTTMKTTDNGQAAYEKRLSDAWKKGA